MDGVDGVEGCPAGVTGSYSLSGIGMGFYMSKGGVRRVWGYLKILGWLMCRKDVKVSRPFSD